MFKKFISNPFFLFPVVTCIFFWPISLEIFTFKNDALTYYYPIRTLISDALHNTELPLWTPFINMGYPLHADMQSGAWNPIIWIIGFFTNYSLAAFHYEMLLYLSVAGIGFYYLGRAYGWNKYVAFIIAIAYEFSGPIIDSMQFTTCISSVSYIPLILLFFRRLLHHEQSLTSALLTAVFLYLLFTGGYPALFIITVYLLLALLLFSFFTAPIKLEFLKEIILHLGVLSVVFILLSLPAIISFINHLNFIDRGKSQSLGFLLENSLPPICMISFLSPFSTTATSYLFSTDLLMRNCFIGIIPLIFLIYSLINKNLRNNKELQFTFITALILFGMAWGSHFFLRQLAYYILPLMNTFRHPGLFRFFGVIFFLIVAGFGLNDWNKKSDTKKYLKKIIITIAVIILLISLIIILLFNRELIPEILRFSEVKKIIFSLTFQQRFLLQIPFILITLILFYWIVVKKKSYFFIVLLSAIDLFFATQFNIPITVIGAKKFSAVAMHINRNSIPFPLPGNTTIEQNSLNSLDTTFTVGSFMPFNKKIGRNDYYITPGNLSLQEKFYESPIKSTVFKNRLLYFTDSLLTSTSNISGTIINPTIKTILASHIKNDTIVIQKLSANAIRCLAISSTPQLLVLLQNNYPGWKVFIDGNESSIYTVNISFIGVKIPAGQHDIQFKYHPVMIIYAWYISLITLLTVTIILLIIGFRKTTFFKQHQ